MKKLNKLFAILVAMAMVLSLTVISAFAATGNKATDEDHPATADYYKTLEVPTGTTVNETFTFSFTAGQSNPDNTAIANQSITITDADKVTSAKEGIDRYIDKNTLEFADNYFGKVGVYEYTVKEVFTPDAESTNTVTGEKDANNVTKTTVYDTSEYLVKIGVAQKADGTTYVDSIGVYKNGTKVDIGEPGEDGTNDFKFDNTMSKKVTDVDPEGKKDDEPGTKDDDALYIQKKVVDKDNAEITPDQEFSFTLTMKAPATVAEGATETYAYAIMKADSTEKKTGTITTGEAVPFQLAAGERLVLKNVSVGASYLVNEAAYNAYTTEDNMGESYAYVTDQGNSKLFTNKYDETKDPATGLSIANLPFIVLALVAVGGLVAYIVVRRKSEDNA